MARTKMVARSFHQRPTTGDIGRRPIQVAQPETRNNQNQTVNRRRRFKPGTVALR